MAAIFPEIGNGYKAALEAAEAHQSAEVKRVEEGLLKLGFTAPVVGAVIPGSYPHGMVNRHTAVRQTRNVIADLRSNSRSKHHEDLNREALLSAKKTLNEIIKQATAMPV